MKHNWNGKQIAAPADTDDLERRAARLQFGDGLTREAADGKAYQDYKVDQHARAAAHHLERAQLAKSCGDHEAAERHQTHYDLHVQALGHKKSAVPPQEVRAHMVSGKPFQKVTGFKNHGADAMLGS